MTAIAWEEFKEFVSANFNIPLSAAQIEQFKTYYAELIECNQRFNLTTLVSEKEILYYHFADSLAAAPAIAGALKTPQNTLAADIGSGAGFPGIPLKIVFPEIQITLIESTKKKCLFLDYVSGKIGLKGIKTVCGRAEELGRSEEYTGKYDIVFNRALANFERTIELSRPFAKPGGRIFSWQTEKVLSGDVFEYNLPGAKKTRYIQVIK